MFARWFSWLFLSLVIKFFLKLFFTIFLSIFVKKKTEYKLNVKKLSVLDISFSGRKKTTIWFFMHETVKMFNAFWCFYVILCEKFRWNKERIGSPTKICHFRLLIDSMPLVCACLSVCLFASLFVWMCAQNFNWSVISIFR